jgi:hypothetical protein
MNRRLSALCGLLLLQFAGAVISLAQGDPAPEARPGASPGAPASADSQVLQIGGASIEIDFASGPLDLPHAAILKHIESAAYAVTVYFGRFPVSRARILVVPEPGGEGEIHGTTWGDRDGFQGFTRLRIGEHTTAADLADDWVTTHELVHMGFPSLPREQHWMEEGLATYIEPIARVQNGELQATQIWADMVHGMPQGEPRPGDEGMDRTHTWGRTYWGGALFCLMADVEIRRQTDNRKGLEDALRAIVFAGGTIDHDWPLDKALEIGDQATGTHVLTQQYAAWKQSPNPVDLPALWSGLGVHSVQGGGIEFIPTAPLAKIREAITVNRSIHRNGGANHQR